MFILIIAFGSIESFFINFGQQFPSSAPKPNKVVRRSQSFLRKLFQPQKKKDFRSSRAANN